MGAGIGRRVASKFRYFARYPDEAQVILAQPYVARPELEGFEPAYVTTRVWTHREAFGAREREAG